MPSLDGTYVRACPDCGAEFVSTVEVCHDCGAPLVTRLADAAADPAAAQRAGAPAAEPPAGWVAIETADLDWAIELRERLAAAGIASCLARDCASCRPSLSVFVAPADLAAARELAQAVYLEKLPDADLARSLAAQREDRCPACGAGLSAEAASCPDCGLAFIEPDGPGQPSA